MSATAETVNYPNQYAIAPGGNPFFFAPNPAISSTPLPDGVNGTFQTLSVMAQCVRGEIGPDFCGHRNPWVVETAKSIASGAESFPNNRLGQIKRIFDFVRDSIEYLPHPASQQVIQDCYRTIQFASGDCVSMSVCVATLLASLGYNVRFVAQYPNDEQQYSHVYCEVLDETGVWIALDAVAKTEPIGWSQKLPAGGWETTYSIF